MIAENRLKEILADLSLEVYTVPVSTDDTLVVLARIQANPDAFSRVEGRLLYFIEKLLQRSEDSIEEFKVRFSRPWVLKESSLRYTWDFTFKGDLDAALRVAESIKIPEIQVTRVDTVSTQIRKAVPKGKVRPVTVGTL